MKEKTIYNLELHEVLKIDEYTNVVRVDSGWVYKFGTWDNVVAVFVPFSNEFQKKY